MTTHLLLGDCLVKLKELNDNSIDSIVTDPPYGLSFMNKKWDYQVPSIEVWKECLRVLKPGGHLLSFSSSRTYHRMVVNVEDAGFEIRDQLMWVYGSGFPKSHNIDKAVKKIEPDNTDYEGWGTALKPSHEPIVMARKPLSEKTIALNVLKYGTGGLNIDASRVPFEDTTNPATNPLYRYQNDYKQVSDGGQRPGVNSPFTNSLNPPNEGGRFPANFIHDGLETEWSRFFYCAKAGKKERNAGCEDLPDKEWKHHKCSNVAEDGIHNANGHGTVAGVSKNNHPTVKPQALMSYLINLVTPQGGTVLDPFMGSGSTGLAAVSSVRPDGRTNDYSFIGVEMDEDYIQIAEKRIASAK